MDRLPSIHPPPGPPRHAGGPGALAPLPAKGLGASGRGFGRSLPQLSVRIRQQQSQGQARTMWERLVQLGPGARFLSQESEDS